MSSDANPYAPPATTGERIETRNANGSPALSVVALIGVLAFTAFTLISLRSSTPGDRKAGMLLLANIPTLAGLAVSAFRSVRVAVYFALGAGIVQIVITIMLLAMRVGDATIVIAINATIALPCLAIAVWAWRSARSRFVAQSLNPNGG